MKRFKSILAVVLTLALLAPMMVTNVRAADTSETNSSGICYLFTEDFSGTADELTNTGWTGVTNFDLESGKLTGKTLNQAYSYLSGNDDWSNYTVEAEVSISETITTAGEAGNGRLAGIHVAAPGNSNGKAAGYEFMICRNNSGSSMYCVLKDRTGDTNNSDNINLTIGWGTTYRLKVALNGNVIRCYVDDVLMITKEIEGVDTLSGTIGLHYSGGKVTTFDNVTVYDKNLISYKEDFSGTTDDLTNAGWVYNFTNNDFVLEDGKLTSGAKKEEWAYLGGNSDWSDYTVEADVVIKEEVISDDGTKVAGIHVGVTGDVSASTGKKGYEFIVTISKDGKTVKCGLRNRDTNETLGTDATLDATKYGLGKEFPLKVVVSGNIIRCYVDDEPMITYTVANTVVGTVGLHYLINKTTFDNVSVYNTNPISFEEDFSGTTDDLTNAGWVYNFTNNDFVLEDGKLTSGATKEEWAYLGGNSDWSDYTVEADVVIKDEVISDDGTKVAGIHVGVTGDVTASTGKRGYEFIVTITSNGKTVKCGLRNRDTGVTLGTDVALDTTKYGLGKEFPLKVVVSGNIIRCYVDNEPMITYTATDTVVGTVGLHYLINKTTFDNVSVYSNPDYYDVTYYRDNRETVTHPFKEGFVFAGWYEDATFTTPIAKSATTCKAYAKFVDEDVLSVKCQITNNTTAESESTNLRLLTTVDSLMYNAVGFTLKTGDVVSQPIMVSEVYDTVYAYVNEANQPYTANQTFAPQSKYFMVHTLTGILQENFDTEYTVIPMWKTLDGTTVTGVTRTFKISDGYASAN